MSVLGFELEWLDEVSGLLQTLFMKFFLDDNTIELLQGHSTFLKRIFYPDVTLSDLFVGNTITIFNRLMVIKNCCNQATIRFMDAREVRFLCKIGRRDLTEFGKLMIIAKKSKLVMGKVLTTSSSFYSDLMGANTGDVIVELVGVLAEGRGGFLKAVGMDLSSVEVVQASAVQIEAAFKSCGKATFRSQNCSLCLIKPHIMKSQLVGELLAELKENGFQVGALFSVHMSLAMGEEFFEVYRTLYVDYMASLEQMCNTPVLAVVITGSGSVVEDFRDFCGPLNPALARTLRPKSLRANYGHDLVTNAVHCTDLPDDGEMECRYFFETLASL